MDAADTWSQLGLSVKVVCSVENSIVQVWV